MNHTVSSSKNSTNRIARVFFVLVGIFGGSTLQAEPRPHGLWNIKDLKRTPEAKFGELHDGVQEVYYAGETYQGKATTVFAYLGAPSGAGPFPAMVLVHGGGGKAFPDWVKHWNKRGYAAIAMDLAGNGSSGRLPDGGPDQDDETKFRDFADSEARDMWTYHAVANVLRAHSLLAADPRVDAKRTGITGISWGGYLTCIAAGIDERFKVAASVYGCGFLADDSYWKPRIDAMSETRRTRWDAAFDPRHFVSGVSCPILFVNGTNDFAYPLDSYRKTYKLVESERRLSIVPRLAHGHIWTFPIVDYFVDSKLRDGIALAALSDAEIVGDTITCTWSATADDSTPVRAELHFTSDNGPWEKRVWKQIPAKLNSNQIKASLPLERPLVCYLAITDGRELFLNTPHIELK